MMDMKFRIRVARENLLVTLEFSCVEKYREYAEEHEIHLNMKVVID